MDSPTSPKLQIPIFSPGRFIISISNSARTIKWFLYILTNVYYIEKSKEFSSSSFDVMFWKHEKIRAQLISILFIYKNRPAFFNNFIYNLNMIFIKYKILIFLKNY